MHLNNFLLATVKSVASSGITIQLDGDDTPLKKRYSWISTGTSLEANDRVLVLKNSGTYVIIGKILGG